MKKATKALGIIGATGAAAHLGFSYYTFRQVFGRNASLPNKIYENEKKKKNNGVVPPEDPRVTWMHEQDFKPYTIKNDRGETLCGFFLEAKEKSDKFVLCSHGYRSRGKGEYRFISKFYHENGYNIFLVDHTAAGDSEGKYISFGYYESRDLLLWAKFLVETFGSDIKIALHGISMGCATVLMLAGNEDLPENVKFVISDCGYTSARDQFETVLRKKHIPTEPLITTAGLINKAVCHYSLGEVKPIDAVRRTKLPMLFIHGGSDSLVPKEMAMEMYKVCPTDKDILIVEHAGHAESYQKDSEAYEEKILNFTKKYM